jgi:hypothetical protein
MEKFKNYNYSQLAYALVKCNATEKDIEEYINYFKKQCESFNGDILRDSYRTWLSVKDKTENEIDWSSI